MNGNPLVTVITPSYNSPYLLETIKSVLNQTYNNIQYIITDDASKDFNEEQIGEYIKLFDSNKEVNIIHNHNNLGTIRNINKALSITKGKYIFFLASDDAFYDNEVVEEWFLRFEQTNSDIITAYRVVCDKTLENEIALLPKPNEINKIKSLSPAELYEDLCGVNYIFGCCTAYRFDLLKSVGFFDEQYRLIEDYSMNLRLSRLGYKIDFWDRVVVKYRVGGVSDVINFNQSYEKDSDLIFNNEILKYCNNKARATKKYLDWKKYANMPNAFYIQKSKAKESKRALIIFCLRYPIYTLKALFRRIREVKM